MYTIDIINFKIPMSIRQKLTLGFGVLVALTLIVVALDHWSSKQAAQHITQTTELRLPTMLASTRAQTDLLRMLSGTRAYLALGEQKYRDDYAQAKKEFEADLLLLEALSSTWTNSQHTTELQKLQTSFEQWATLPEQLFELRDDQLRREPALRILMQEAQPFLLNMTLSIRRLLETQGQREPSREQLTLLEEMANFQASFYAMVAGLRSYVTTGRESFKFEYHSNLTNNHEFLRKLQKKQEALTPAQRKLLVDILTHRESFLQLPERIFRVLEGEQSREDLFLFKTQAVPLAEAMLESLESMTTTQQTSFLQEISSGVHKLALARRNALIGGGLALLVGTVLALILRQNLVDRIERVTEGARRIQGGDLSTTIPVDSSDEIGILGHTFNTMSAQLHQMMEDLTGAKNSAEAANRAKSTFLANMSHELRSPLNAIIGFTQVIRHNPSLPQEEQEHLGIIMRSGEHLLSLINQVLDLSKIEAGRTTLNPGNVDLHAVLQDVWEMFRLRAEEKHLRMLFEQAENVPQFIRSDEVKLRQVLINLLNNAVKFTEEGGVALRVRRVCSMHSAESRTQGEPASSSPPSAECILAFEIEDSGPGIAPEEIDSVFEAFGQSQSGRHAQEGTGLGLPISRKFIQMMSGDIQVESELDRGSIFRFNIQCRELNAGNIQQRTRPKRVIALEPGQEHYRMLIVDDSWTNRQLLLKLLSPLGFELREAANGQEAIEIWEFWQPHLIWMDMRMPVLNGYEATKRIRALGTPSSQPSAPSIRFPLIIASTASSFDDEQAAILDAGCDDFLLKPFREEELFDVLSKHLGLRFVYKEEDRSTDKPEGGALETPQALLTPERFRALPSEWLKTFKQSTQEADITVLLSTIEQIRETDSTLADALVRLVDDFQYDTILALLREATEGEQP